jgi:hypothetical protein
MYFCWLLIEVILLLELEVLLSLLLRKYPFYVRS